jgi:hypothetical protein
MDSYSRLTRLCPISSKFQRESRANIVIMEIVTVDKKLAEQIIAHVENARAFERRRQPTLRVDSSRSSSRIECLMCGVGIRKETSPINGMHPNCNKIANDPSLVLTMNVNTHAARAIMDRLYVQAKRNADDIKKEEAEKIAHAEMIRRFEQAEVERESSENVAS